MKETDAAAYTEGAMTTVPLMPVDPRGTVLGDEVYNAIGEAILDGRLAPGEHLRDQELARWLGVSRTPVREALQRLERTGLVEVSPNRFTRVTQPDPGLVEETHEFVVLLLGNIVRLAIARCSDETLAAILDDIDAVIEASRIDDRMGLIDGSARLFSTFTHAAGNRAFVRVMREAELAIRRNLAGWHPFIECPVRRTEGYEAFRAAVAARDGEAAERALRGQHGLLT
jgi:DNA-binding GntR family transcriptional regulator